MKKIVPILVVGILVISGFGAVASSTDIKSDKNIEGTQSQLQAEVKCGLGARVTITNVGTETFEGDLLCNITISGLIYYKTVYHSRHGIELSPGESIRVRTLKTGFGPTTVTVKLFWEGGEVSGSTSGFMLFFLILGAPPIVIP